MDKYAVDLDQVLNDFEYSELTDQYTNASARSNAPPTQLPIQNNVTKHSINNVFHSLNEYLNTNIDIKSLNQIDNNLENKINVSQNIKYEPSKLETDETPDFKSEINENNNVSVVDGGVEFVEEQSDDREGELVDIQDGHVETIESDAGNGEIDTVVEGVADVLGDDSVLEVSVEDDSVQGDEVEVEQVLDNVEVVEELAPAPPQVVSDFIEAEKKVGFGEDIDLDDSEISKLLEELETEENEINIEESQNVEGCENDSETKECDSIVQVTEIEENIVKDDIIEENQATKVSEVREALDLDLEENNTQLVGAGDSNVSDFEVKPDKVELNDDTPPQIEDYADNDDKEESIEVLDENAETENPESLSRPQILALPVESEEPKRKIDLIGEPGSTPYNNVYINKEIPRDKGKEYDSDTDYSTSSSPTFSEASTTASTVSIDEAPVDKAETETVTNLNAGPGLEIETDIEKPGSSEVPVNSETSEGAEGASAPDSEPQIGVENVGEVNVNVNAMAVGKQWLGKEAPLWIPDSEATSCLHCDMKFTVLKRRHHCRACGLVLCSKCCHLRFRLEYLDAEARVCNKCHDILNRDPNSGSGSDMSPEQGDSPSYRPHPNNPLDYCSTVSPLQQVAGNNPPPAVMVPVGVLKRKGSNKAKSNKSVMFCDGIRPGSDLTNLDNDFDYNNTKTRNPVKSNVAPPKPNTNLPIVDPQTNTFIPNAETGLPPTVSICKTDITYTDCSNEPTLVDTLKTEQLTFAIHVNLYVHLKIINMTCCINKMAWCFSTEGMINVGQDEIVILLEYIDEESFVPKDVFYHINNVYEDAVKGNSVKEMGLSLHNASNFLDSKNHAGFVYIRPTFQCLEQVIKPSDPYLIGILIHRWETPWAKLFPLRLVLRLGAEYRYYPSPIISTRHRDSVFVEIGHTIINLLADFRNFSYTLPQIRGLTIHMEDKNTTITIPVNRYDQVMKSMNNSSDHILAFAGNFSSLADSHLVCIQDTQGNENCYSTHAINIHNKPRKTTGASFIVFNGALKSTSGLTAKSNIVEDGLMIQVLPEHMEQIRESLRAMRDHVVSCGCVNAASDETVNIVWGENDVNFNVGVVSAIDNAPLSGVPSIRVHNGKNHVCVNGSRLIRWTEVFILKSGDDTPKNQDPVDMSRVSESIAKATCEALVKYLDLLVANGCQKIGIRTTLHVDNVSYLAGSNGAKLAPIYMKSLDDELIPVLHRITTNNLGDNAVVLELIFRILNV